MFEKFVAQADDAEDDWTFGCPNTSDPLEDVVNWSAWIAENLSNLTQTKKGLLPPPFLQMTQSTTKVTNSGDSNGNGGSPAEADASKGLGLKDRQEPEGDKVPEDAAEPEAAEPEGGKKQDELQEVQKEAEVPEAAAEPEGGKKQDELQEVQKEAEVPEAAAEPEGGKKQDELQEVQKEAEVPEAAAEPEGGKKQDELQEVQKEAEVSEAAAEPEGGKKQDELQEVQKETEVSEAAAEPEGGKKQDELQEVQKEAEVPEAAAEPEGGKKQDELQEVQKEAEVPEAAEPEGGKKQDELSRGSERGWSFRSCSRTWRWQEARWTSRGSERDQRCSRNWRSEEGRSKDAAERPVKALRIAKTLQGVKEAVFFPALPDKCETWSVNYWNKHVIEIKFPPKKETNNKPTQTTKQATPTHKPRHGPGKSVREICKLVKQGETYIAGGWDGFLVFSHFLKVLCCWFEFSAVMPWCQQVFSFRALSRAALVGQLLKNDQHQPTRS